MFKEVSLLGIKIKIGDIVRVKKNKECIHPFMSKHIPQFRGGELVDIYILDRVLTAKVRINKKSSFSINIDHLELATKTCKCCKKDLEYKHFYKDHGKCKECMKKERDAKKVHLCNTCAKEYPVCDGNITEFGNGKGNDNVVKCSGYTKNFLKNIKKEDVFLVIAFILYTLNILFFMEVI